MKILITGSRGLAQQLGKVYVDQSVTLVSRSNGFDINNVDQWGIEFLDSDCVFNCAYDGFAQVKVLEFFYHNWKHNADKKIITIGSIAHTCLKSHKVIIITKSSPACTKSKEVII